MPTRIKAHEWAEKNTDLLRRFSDCSPLTWMEAAKSIGADIESLPYVLMQLKHHRQENRRRIWCALGSHLDNMKEMSFDEFPVSDKDIKGKSAKKEVQTSSENIFSWIGCLLAEITANYYYCKERKLLVVRKGTNEYLEICQKEHLISDYSYVQYLDRKNEIIDYFSTKYDKLKNRIKTKEEELKNARIGNKSILEKEIEELKNSLKKEEECKENTSNYILQNTSRIYIRTHLLGQLDSWCFASLLAGLSPFQLWNSYKIPIDHLVSALIEKALVKRKASYLINIPEFLLNDIEDSSKRVVDGREEITGQIKKSINIIRDYDLKYSYYRRIFCHDSNGFAHQAQFYVSFDKLYNIRLENLDE